MADETRYSRAVFAAGCFWDVEAAFRGVEGVVETVAGYTGGSVTDPSYEQVESGTTGHVQAVGVVFDPDRVSYDQLLAVFFTIHDPTQEGGQGDYSGPQYRSVIFTFDADQEAAAKRVRDQMVSDKMYGDRPILTTIEPVREFYPAEESHQQFYEKCGRCFGASRQIYE